MQKILLSDLAAIHILQYTLQPFFNLVMRKMEYNKSFSDFMMRSDEKLKKAIFQA
jgi:hypothetical protein